jgi:hypothetical protein
MLYTFHKEYKENQPFYKTILGIKSNLYIVTLNGKMYQLLKHRYLDIKCYPGCIYMTDGDQNLGLSVGLHE